MPFAVSRFVAVALLTIAFTVASAADPWQQRLRDDIKYLASEELAGRSSTEPEIHKAAKFVAKRFDEIGLQTELFDGSPFQRLEIPAGVRLGKPNDLTFLLTDGSEPLTGKLEKDFTPMAIGVSEATVEAPVVFVGYGIRSADKIFDEYADIDCTDKVVLILRKTPGTNLTESDQSKEGIFSDKATIPEAFFTTKIQNAIDAGASAVILINDLSSTNRAVAAVEARIKTERDSSKALRSELGKLPKEANNLRLGIDERLTQSQRMVAGLENDKTQSKRGLIGMTEAGNKPFPKQAIPVISISREMANRVLVAGTGRTLAEHEKQIHTTRLPVSTALAGVRIRSRIAMSKSNTETDNVLGVIPGKGPLAHQTVVIGAHYDHVGMGKFGSLSRGVIAVHNGADDNASGTSAMIATAGQMVNQLAGVDNHRRILFIAFTAEERGLLGSKFYARNPRFPLNETVAMINLDMVGRLRDNELTVYGIGTADCMDSVVEKANEEAQFRLFKVASGYGPSDHQSFSEVGVPVLFYFTGLHTDYHRPDDDFDRLNYEALEKIVGVVKSSAVQLATRIDRPVHQDTVRKVTIRRQMTAYLGVTMKDQAGQVTISGVSKESPAQRGGLQAGDQILKLTGADISSSSDIRDAIRRKGPGQNVKIKLIRNGQILNLQVRLGTRPL